MRAIALVILVLLGAFISCNSSDTANGPTGGEHLPTTSYSIDPTRDTVLRTPGGALLKIAAGTFDAGDAKVVQLETKEAYTTDEMIKGNLSTRAGDTALHSDGVIFVQLAAGQQVSIQKAIGVSIPAKMLEAGMKVYGGRLDENGIVNWGVPQALAGDPGMKLLKNGKAVYLANCASCHHLKGNLTGPSLAFLLSRRDRQWLLDYSRNNVRLLWRGDPYSCFLFNRYRMSPMPTFPNLSDEDLEGVFQYVTGASKAMGLDSNAVANLKPSFDSCVKNDANCSGVTAKMAAMHGGDTSIRVVAASVATDAGYYTFSIDKHGWYNIAAAGGGGGEKVAVDTAATAAFGTGEVLEPLQSCPCWCNESAYRKADSIARAKPAN